MKKRENEGSLRIKPRETEVVPLAIPKKVVASLERVAAQRDMSYQALMKFYIGQGLRHDLAHLYGKRVLETAAEVLARHLLPDDEVALIVREIRESSVGWTG